MTSKFQVAGSHGASRASLATEEREHNMPSSEKLIERGEVVALESGRDIPAEMVSVLSRGLQTLYRYAYRLLGNQHDAEDAVQDALLAGYKHLDQFRGEAQLSTWLTTIVINCAKMQLRKRSRHTHVSLDSRIGEEQEHRLSDMLVDHRPSPEDECHRSILNARLMKSAEGLSPRLRKTFQLRCVDHLSVDETARVLGVPIGTVKGQTARARAKLRKSIQGVFHKTSRSRKRSR